MRQARVVILLAAAAVALSGCVAQAPSSSIAAASTPAGSLASAEPSPSSPCDGPNAPQRFNSALLERESDVIEEIFLTITAINPAPSDPAAWPLEVVPAEPRALDPTDPTAYIGGAPVTFDLAFGDDVAWVPRITTARVRIGPDAAHLAEARTSISGTKLSIDLPDVTGIEVLDATIDFADGCATVEARALLQVRLFSAAVAAACPQTPDGLQGLATSIDRSGFSTADGTVVPFVASSGEGRFLPSLWAADGPQLSAWRATSPVVRVTADGTLRLTPGSLGIELSGMTALFYRRADVIADPTGQSIRAVMRTSPATAADGSITLKVPRTIGRYVLLLDASYSTPCLVGDGFLIGSVDTH
jgi:hypothetical protein